MTNITQNPVNCTSRDHTRWSPDFLEAKTELEALDCQVGREYLPIDVFVDPDVIKEHFQVSSIRVRWTRIHPGAT